MISTCDNAGPARTNQQQEEHGECDEDRHTQRDLRIGIRRQVEYQTSENRDADAGQSQVDGVEERLAAEVHAICDVDVPVGGRTVDQRTYG